MIYLNNAATSYPKPPCVINAVQACLNSAPASQFRGSREIGRDDIENMCREKLGELLGIHTPERIYFTSGATEALNTLLCGLELGDSAGEIVVTQTEHNSVLRPLMNQAALKNRKVRIVRCEEDGEITLESLRKTLDDKTRLLIVNHCSNVSGRVQDMEELGDFCRDREILFLADVSQSAGCLPVDAEKWGADGLVFTGHKSLLGIQGTGGFYLRKGLALKPLKFGGTGRNSSQLIYETDDYEYETGTQNLPGITALHAGTEFILKEGIAYIMEKERSLMKALYSGLEQTEGIIVYGSYEKCHGPVMSMNFKGLTASDAAYILQNGYNITVRAGLHCSPLIHKAMGTEKGGTVRISVSYFTQEEEIQAFLRAVRETAACLKGKVL